MRTKPFISEASVAKPYRDPLKYSNREPSAAPSHTVALLKPFVDQSNFQFVESAHYKPFLRPQDYTLLDQYETHEGEVLEGNVHSSDGNEYHTIDETADAPGDTSYLPEQQSSDTNSSVFSGYAESLHPLVIDGVSLTTVEPALIINEIAVPVKSNKNLYALYYIGYKLWYIPVLFSIYHAIMMLFYLLTLLAKHYTAFPTNLQAAASSSLD